jgi:hypothetical protein
VQALEPPRGELALVWFHSNAQDCLPYGLWIPLSGVHIVAPCRSFLAPPAASRTERATTGSISNNSQEASTPAVLTLLQLLTSEITQSSKPARLSALQLLDCLLSSAGSLHIGDTCRRPPKPPAKPSATKSKEGEAKKEDTATAAAGGPSTSAAAAATQQGAGGSGGVATETDTGAAPMEDVTLSPPVSTGMLPTAQI